MLDFAKEAHLGLLFLRFAKDPTNTDLIFKMSDVGRSLKKNHKMISDLESELQKESPLYQAWLEKWIPDLPEINELKGMLDGSLGKAYFDHLIKNNLKINFYPQTNPGRFVDYISYRLYSCHDLWHVLLGYDVSPQGESEIQAFTLAQIKSPTSVMLMTAGFLNLLKHQPETTPLIYSKCVDAYQRGRNAKFLLNIKLEDMLSEPIENLRAKLCLT